MDSVDLNRIDLISSLPDEILCDILSRVPTKYAVATSVLSTRWKHIPSLIRNIDMSDYEVGARSLSYSRRADLIVASRAEFTQFVGNVLSTRILPDRREVDRFRLFCSIVYDQYIIADWINTVLLLNVRELDLFVKLEEFGTLPSEIFRCKSLEVLKLGTGFDLDVPESAFLPNLKQLILQFVVFSDQASFRKLLSSCPVLEDLRIISCLLRQYCDIEIAHPLLKTLVLSFTWDECDVTFDTPNLQNILYNGDGYMNASVKNMKSLAHAFISWGSVERQITANEINDHDLLLTSARATGFINGMHKVRSLYMDGSSLNALYFSGLQMATFQNLTMMELGCTPFSGWLMLPDLLAKSPNLEVLVFFEGFIYRDAPEKEVKFLAPDSIPSCFSRSLKVIKVAEFEGHNCELELLEYFLGSVQVLEKMVIGSQASKVTEFEGSKCELELLEYFLGIVQVAKEMVVGSQASSKSPFGFPKNPPAWVLRTCKRLLSAPRCSKACQIMITWEEDSKKNRNIILN